MQEAITKGLSYLSDELELSVKLDLRDEDEREQKSAAEEDHLNRIIEEQPNNQNNINEINDQSAAARHGPEPLIRLIIIRNCKKPGASKNAPGFLGAFDN